MAQDDWRTAGEKIRSLFGRHMTTTERLDVVDVLVPVGRTGVELLVATSEVQPVSEQRDAIHALQGLLDGRSDKYEVVGVFVSAKPLSPSILAEALERMDDKEVIPLTSSQAEKLASLDDNVLDMLEPIHELVKVAASRPKADLANAADELLSDIDIMIERQDSSEPSEGS